MVTLHIGSGPGVQAILFAYAAMLVIGACALLFVVFCVIRALVKAATRDEPPKPPPRDD